MKTTLINYRTYNAVSLEGVKQSLTKERQGNLDKSKITPIDRTSIFGNPFFINETTTRRLSVKLYKNCFYKRIKWDKKFRIAVQNLKGKTLGCWCRPMGGFKGKLLCHGQIIIAYLEGCNPEEVE